MKSSIHHGGSQIYFWGPKGPVFLANYFWKKNEKNQKYLFCRYNYHGYSRLLSPYVVYRIKLLLNL